MHCFSFDIETIPDVEFGRRAYQLDGLGDEDVAAAMTFLRQQATGSEFLPLYLHRVVAISVALRTNDSFRVWSLGDRDAGEAELIGRFFDGLERYSPDLISWNGSGFDLPVLHYRALRHGVQAPRYWEMGDSDRDFRFNNYLSRYHSRHMDLMDVLSSFQGRARVSLEGAALLLGLPGKLGMSGDKVWDAYLEGQIDAIRNYCETDVLNTYLIYLRFELIRGRLLPEEYRGEVVRVRDVLSQQAKPHFQEFLAAWQEPHC